MYKYREREKRCKMLRYSGLLVLGLELSCKSKCNIDITFV